MSIIAPSPLATPRPSAGLPAASRTAGIAVALVGVAVLGGWILDIDWLKGLSSTLATMKPNTALAFLLAGTALSLLAPRAPDRRVLRIAQGCALTVVLVAVSTLVEYASGWDFGIDELLFADTQHGTGTPFPGRMGVNTALSFLLLGLALLGLDTETRGGQRPAQFLALAGGAVAVVALVGYVYSVTILYGLASYTQMALHTAGTFVLLTVGILVAHPERGAMATLTGRGPGSVMARRFLPAALGVPLAVGWVRLEGQRAGLYGTEVGLALMVTATMSILSFVAWFSATRLNQADAAQREREATFRLLFSSNPLPMWVYDAATMYFLEVNGAAVAHYGYSRDEFLRMRLTDIRPLEDVPRLEEALRAAHADPGVRRQTTPWRHRLKDGRERDVETVSHSLNFAGRRAALVVAIDVTEVKQTQEALAKYAERLSILHEIDRALIAARPPVEIAEAVLRRLRDLLGVPRAIVNLFDLAAGEAEWLAAAGRRRIRLGPGVRFPLELMGDVEALRRGELQVIDVASLPRSPDAEALLASGVRVYMVVPMIAGGELIGGLSFGGATGQFPPEQVSIAQEAATQLAIAIAQARLYERVRRQTEELEQRVRERTRDLSAVNEKLEREIGERRRAEAEADRANQAKSEFLANMSHELRTPLNGVIGFAELMHDGKVGPVSAEHKEYLGDILTSARHLLQLINDVLDLSKVESGKMEFRPEPIELARVVGEARDILRALAAQKRIQVRVDVDRGLGTVVADPAKLTQVLYNYLSNALKFTPEQGQVTIRVRGESDKEFVVEVEDSGTGIRPEDIGKLFAEFKQLDARTGKKHAGTGLGLALTKRIVEAQGGRVGVRSTPGQGSVFFAVLPRTVRPAQVQPGVPTPPTA